MKDKYDKYFESRKIIISAYTPAAFCAFISCMALFASMNDANWWRPMFFAFLPMCFFYYAFTMHAVIKKVRDLQATVNDLNDENKANI